MKLPDELFKSLHTHALMQRLFHLARFIEEMGKILHLKLTFRIDHQNSNLRVDKSQ